MTDPRQKPAYVNDERTMLVEYLRYFQQTLARKTEGLSDDQLRTSFVPSGIALLSLLKHTAWVHRWWFRRVLMGEDVPMIWSDADPDADWRIEPDDTYSSIRALYDDETARALAIAAAYDVDAVVVRGTREIGVRWVLIHMVEELARHSGHADIFRELADGTTGE
jgi:uncharacterized damage-inducible protein DinB